MTTSTASPTTTTRATTTRATATPATKNRAAANRATTGRARAHPRRAAAWRALAAGAVAGTLAACATAENVDELNAEAAAGSAFTRALAAGYADFARSERDAMYDWRDATHFADKGLRAERGEAVPPETLGAWRLAPESRRTLAGARRELVARLESGARERHPDLAAAAQSRFDCWVEQQAEGHQADHIAACRDGYARAMAGIAEARRRADAAAASGPGAGDPTRRQLASADPGGDGAQAVQVGAVEPARVTVHFGFDRRRIAADEHAALARAARIAGRDPDARIVVTGHTDTVGTRAYNRALSRDRADAVKAALMARGVQAGRIALVAKGESAPAVATGDGVREPRNRRVTIAVE